MDLGEKRSTGLRFKTEEAAESLGDWARTERAILSLGAPPYQIPLRNLMARDGEQHYALNLACRLHDDDKERWK